MNPDPYRVLGVPRTASDSDIKKAFRKRAREVHPDLNPSDGTAAHRFREIRDAYELLADPQRRRAFDQSTSGAAQGQDRYERQRQREEQRYEHARTRNEYARRSRDYERRRQAADAQRRAEEARRRQARQAEEAESQRRSREGPIRRARQSLETRMRLWQESARDWDLAHSAVVLAAGAVEPGQAATFWQFFGALQSCLALMDSTTDDAESARAAWDRLEAVTGTLTVSEVARRDADLRRIEKALAQIRGLVPEIAPRVRAPLDGFLRREINQIRLHRTSAPTGNLQSLLRLRELLDVSGRLDAIAVTRSAEQGRQLLRAGLGKVKWYSDERGFGFLTDSRSGQDIWFSVREMPGQRPPDVWANFSYDVVSAPKGPRAARILQLPASMAAVEAA